MNKTFVRNLTIAFLCFVPVWMFACKDVKFSEKENRNLASVPKLTWSSITGGRFMDDFETYLTDQFPLRNLCVSIKTAVLRGTGRRYINDVYIGKEGYLIAKESVADYNRVDRLTESINKFADNVKGVSVDFLLIPNTSLIYEDKLPYGAKSNEKEVISHINKTVSDKVNTIDVTDVLIAKANEGLYYKTDHHWKTKAAYYTFRQYAAYKGITPVNYNFYDVTGNFQGTQSSNSGVYSTYETVTIGVPDNSIGTYTVEYVNEGKKTTSLFDDSKLKEKDKYQVFLGGNFAQVDITTTAGTGRNLMIIKDSYANCFIPLLTPYYDKITVIDPRYFYDDIYTLIEAYGISDVLFMYNVNSYVEDNSLEDILSKS
ncbi:DHHW family protein [Eshraghiella crossota]|jgi:hypothetical protein|uniref:DHHW family protein n=1 Tax=Eshraghiella crossota TaxID=45851 RepID=UPI00095B8A66|nr:MAG: hypothetical protein BHV86_08265 [Butyrivibrio crossotus]